MGGWEGGREGGREGGWVGGREGVRVGGQAGGQEGGRREGRGRRFQPVCNMFGMHSGLIDTNCYGQTPEEVRRS